MWGKYTVCNPKQGKNRWEKNSKFMLGYLEEMLGLCSFLMISPQSPFSKSDSAI